MQITLIPQRRDDLLTISKDGDTLIINGEPFDLQAISEGATLPCAAVSCAWLVSDIERLNGVLHLSLILPHGANAPQETLFPATLTISADGAIPLPPHSLPLEETPNDEY